MIRGGFVVVFVFVVMVVSPYDRRNILLLGRVLRHLITLSIYDYYYYYYYYLY